MSSSLTVPTPDAKAPVLNSWKEIASYMGRGVRTVQRYERHQDLPVHRIGGRSRSSVMAFPAELDLWLHSTPTAENHPDAKRETNLLVGSVRLAISDSQGLRIQSRESRVAHHKAMCQLKTNLDRVAHAISCLS